MFLSLQPLLLFLHRHRLYDELRALSKTCKTIKARIADMHRCGELPWVREEDWLDDFAGLGLVFVKKLNGRLHADDGLPACVKAELCAVGIRFEETFFRHGIQQGGDAPIWMRVLIPDRQLIQGCTRKEDMVDSVVLFRGYIYQRISRKVVLVAQLDDSYSILFQAMFCFTSTNRRIGRSDVENIYKTAPLAPSQTHTFRSLVFDGFGGIRSGGLMLRE